MAQPIRKPHQEPSTLVKHQKAVEIYESILDYHKQTEKILNEDNDSQQSPPKIEDILNCILPPRDWTDNFDKLYIQYVSHQPASRQDVIDLQQRLDKMLQDRQARSKGVCPIREQLYSQVFDQIIRQVAVDCPERGLLLMRVRDEHKMTLAAYQTVYQAAVTFAINKQVEAQKKAGNSQEEYKQLQVTKKKLQEKRDMLICQKDLLERQIRQKQTASIARRQQQLRYHKLQTENLQNFFKILKEELK